MVVKCPVCKGTQVGKVGSDQYYCWNCFLEFNYNRGRVNLYQVEEDGSLLEIEKTELL
ncbi:hypothetical protein [Thermosyntropha sp.]|uniref:hypothetical protein n=1 Tax=Thermosyntropha sp. TaxID=2740820 RepID=UPI0025FA0A6F|nr:hypothetical protein [Thermosyntropha sp.]MBO8159816.1 hypothetical protein [Thermosyntropha sp.]